MKKIALIMSALMLTGNMTAFASPEFTPVFNPASGKVTLSGTSDGINTVMIAPSSAKLEDLGESKPPVDFHQITVNESFTYDFYMPDNAVYGKYSVYMSNADGITNKDFIYFEKASADKIISDDINSVASESEFIQVLSEKAAELGIDTENENYGSDVLSLMYNLYENYTDSSDFSNKYNYCLAVCALNVDAENVPVALGQFAEILGIDYSADFSNNSLLTDKIKTKLCSYIAGLDYADVYKVAEDLTGKIGFGAVFEAYCALSAINSAESWITINSIFNEDYSFLTDNVLSKNSDYEKDIETSVFSKMADMSFEKIGDLKSNFDNAVDEVLYDIAEDINLGSGGSGSSGGGGFGGGGGTVISAPSVSKTEPQYEQTTGEAVKNVVTYSMPTLVGSMRYPDTDEGAWYYEAVSTLGGSGIINGDENGNFRADDYITRAEFAKLIVNAFSVKGGSGSFDDVSADVWYAPYVANAAGAGLIFGSGGKFMPDEYITRQDAAVILYRAAELLGVSYVGFRRTADINDVSLYAWTAVGALYSNQLISGVGGGKFEPLSNITRAQAAQLIYNVIIDMSNRI